MIVRYVVSAGGGPTGAAGGDEATALAVAQRVGLPDGPIVTAALERLISLKYAVKRDEAIGAVYRPVAQALG